MTEPMYIVVYQPKGALNCETEFHGPFMYHEDAENHLVTLPAAIDCECKYIASLIAPPPFKVG